MSDVPKFIFEQLNEQCKILMAENKNLLLEKNALMLEKNDLIHEKNELTKMLKNAETLMDKVGVFPYLRMKFELYGATWDLGWQQTNFKIDDKDIPANLFQQTQENFKAIWKKWFNILEKSKAPGVTRFLKNLRQTFPGCTIKDFSKHIALVICLLNNAMHGPVGSEALVAFTDVDRMISALKAWNITDPDLLNVIKIFEQTTTS